jgi:uncharacterized protein YqgV (UPF0045/DUF77 family)
MEREYKLGKDLNETDSLLDGFTFEDVITAVRCGEEIINSATVRRVVSDILENQKQDLHSLLRANMSEIIKRAKKGREQ